MTLIFIFTFILTLTLTLTFVERYKGKLRVIKDCGNLSLCLNPLLNIANLKFNEEDLGQPYNEYKIFKTLLMIDNDNPKQLIDTALKTLNKQIKNKSNSTTGNIRPSIVWHLMISMGPDVLER